MDLESLPDLTDLPRNDTGVVHSHNLTQTCFFFIASLNIYAQNPSSMHIHIYIYK